MAQPDTKRWKRKYLNGEVLFRYYWGEMGSARTLSKLVMYCVSQGWVNPWTGQPPRKMTLHKAMYRWATQKDNFEASYQVVQNEQRDEGNFMTREEWKEFLRKQVKSAWQFPRPVYYERFLKKHGYV